MPYKEEEDEVKGAQRAEGYANSQLSNMNGITTHNNQLRIENGHLVVADADPQTAETVVLANRGELRDAPLVGGELTRMLGGPISSLQLTNLKQQIKSQGIDIRSVEYADGKLNILK